MSNTQSSYDNLMNNKMPDRLEFNSKKLNKEIIITIQEVNAEDSLLEIYPKLLTFCNVNKSYDECELKVWGLMLQTLFNASLSGGIVENEAIVESFKSMANIFNLPYFINTLMNNVNANNYDIPFKIGISQFEYDAYKDKEFNNIKNTALNAVFYGVTAIIDDEKMDLSRIDLSKLFNIVEIYTLAYKVLQKRYGKEIKTIIESLQVKK